MFFFSWGRKARNQACTAALPESGSPVRALFSYQVFGIFGLGFAWDSN